MSKINCATEPHRKFSVSLLSASQEVFDYISWRLWDPLVLAAGIPEIRADVGEACDLLIAGERLPDQRQNVYENYQARCCGDFLAGLAGARGIIAVQPSALGEPPCDDVAKRCGVAFRHWHAETPRQSHATDHPLYDLPRGLRRSTDNFHITFDWHLEIEAPAENVVTRLASGAPDVVQNGRACFAATNLFSDLLWHTRHPNYPDYEASASALLVSLVRTALGEPPIVPPSVVDYDHFRMVFYGYAFARKFVLELQSLKEEGPIANERITTADGLVATAARRLLAGDPDAARRLLRKGGDQLLAARQALTQVKPYFVRGWHGGLLVDRMEGGEILGYAEWGWPSLAMRWAEDRLYAAENKNTPTVNQVCGIHGI